MDLEIQREQSWPGSHVLAAMIGSGAARSARHLRRRSTWAVRALAAAVAVGARALLAAAALGAPAVLSPAASLCFILWSTTLLTGTLAALPAVAAAVIGLLAVGATVGSSISAPLAAAMLGIPVAIVRGLDPSWLRPARLPSTRVPCPIPRRPAPCCMRCSRRAPP